jgi:hypothetical protein
MGQKSMDFHHQGILRAYCIEKTSSAPLVSPGHEIKTEYAREMFESSLMRPRARVLLTQGKAPQDLNGLLLVHPDDFHVFAAGIVQASFGQRWGKMMN